MNMASSRVCVEMAGLTCCTLINQCATGQSMCILINQCATGVLPQPAPESNQSRPGEAA